MSATLYGPVLASSDEFIPVEVRAPADPTGGTVSFSAVAVGTAGTGSFTSGTWGTWDATTSTASALMSSPVTLSLTAGRYRIYGQVAVGAESPVPGQVCVLIVVDD